MKAAQSDPDFVPARILNEFVYCPRLAYMEWVQKEWADNHYTLDGIWVHRRVDVREGWLPSEEEMEDMPFRSRSVDSSCSELGLVAKLDLVEMGAGLAMPVEYKRGRPPKGGGDGHPSDIVQLVAQAMLLEANGWKVERGCFFYSEARSRVELEITDELRAWTRAQLAELRAAFLETVPPDPLVASPKCTGCSLNQICLPDETNFLKSESKAPDQLRQLLAPRDEALPLYIQAQGLSVGMSGETLEIREKGTVVSTARLIDVSQLCLLGNIQLSTQSLRELANRNIPVCYFSFGGWFSAITTGMSHSNAELRIAQYRASSEPLASLRLARRLVSAKILNSRTFLRRNGDAQQNQLDELKRLSQAAEQADKLESLLGLEGMAARVYFQNFQTMIKAKEFLEGSGFDFEGRRRRPPPDPLNCILSYLYGLLTKEFAVTCLSIGFDPFLGFYHQPRYGKPALALDLMEEFRVLVADSVALNLVNTRILSASDFTRRGNGVALSQNARRKVLEAYERRLQELVTHPWFGYKISYRRILYVQTRLLARHLMGEIETFPPFLTR